VFWRVSFRRTGSYNGATAVISNTGAFSVNEKSAFLTLDSNKNPLVTCTDGLKLGIPNDRWGRWYLRTHFKHLDADPAATLWYKEHDPLNIAPISGLLLPPRDYQRLALFRMMLGNCALFLDMGLGKTFISIAFALWLKNNGFGNFFVVLCPPSIFVSWQDDIKKFSSEYEIVLAHGPKKEKNLAKLRAEMPTKPTFIITTYETLENVREKIQSLPIAAVFCDESSKIKNWEANRTQSTFRFVNAIPSSRRFVLSGTPSTKDPLGLFAQFEILGPSFSGHPSYVSFENRYAISKNFITVKLPHGRVTSLDFEYRDLWLAEHNPPNSNVSYAQLGFKFAQRVNDPFKEIPILNFHKRNIKFINQDELHGIVQLNAYTLKKTDVLHELPPKTRQVRTVELSAEQRKAYTEVMETCRTEIGNTPFSFHTKTSPHMKLQQIANGYLINGDGSLHFFKSQPKLQELEQIIEEAGEQKIIVWSPFRPQISQIDEFLTEKKISHVVLHGGVAIKDRPDVVHAIQDADGPQVAVINPSVGGLGLNLTSACLAVFMSNWYSPDVRSQAEDREWRIGQTKPVTVLDVLAQGTLERRVLRTVLGEIKSEQRLISMSVLLGKEDDDE
jgi:SNF2 family DNA or RNA helicase